jgi:hypothetical protein
MTDTRVDDIALFFLDGEEKVKCWVSHHVYADPKFKLGSSAPWKGAVFLEESKGAESPHYVTNLSKLDDPGTTEALAQKRRPPPAAYEHKARSLQPQPGDLIVIPWDKADEAYLVPKARYQDENQCPRITESSGADLRFMALTEGVVLANVPKTDPQGMTCYLLNLLALRSGSPTKKKTDRNDT